MPTYDYLCGNCDHAFEKFQSITASPSKKCPECGRMKLNRLIGTGSGIIFKGSGFYQTDYRSDSYNQAKNEAKKPTEKTDNKTTKTESKTKDTTPKTTAPEKQTKKTA